MARKKAAKKPSNAALDAHAIPKLSPDSRVMESVVGSFSAGDWKGLLAAVHAVECAGGAVCVREEIHGVALTVIALRLAP